MRNNKQKGFSLIELLIVVAIILIIAAIAIPNLLRSKMAANEASAVASLRTYNTAIVSYSTTYGTDPSTNLSDLGPRPPRLPRLRTWLTTCSVRSPGEERLHLHVHARNGIQQHHFAILDHGPAPVLFDRPALLLHRPERCDSPDHRRHGCNGRQQADRIIAPHKIGNEGERHFTFSLVSICDDFSSERDLPVAAQNGHNSDRQDSTQTLGERHILAQSNATL